MNAEAAPVKPKIERPSPPIEDEISRLKPQPAEQVKTLCRTQLATFFYLFINKQIFPKRFCNEHVHSIVQGDSF
jgi:hypothetical protein